jgi:hypothetical protein
MRASDLNGRLRYTTEEYEFTEKNPWGYKIDSGLCLKTVGYEIEGIASIHQKDGWTALSFWDRSIDDRHKSNSNFLAEGTFNFEEMLAISKKHFPEIFERFKFEVVEMK